MRFIVQKTLDNARLGLIEGVVRLPDFKYPSPNVFFYTKGGVVPFLTADIFEHVTVDCAVLNLPVQGITHFHERMKRFNGNIADFIGMPKNLTFVSITDPGQKRIPGYHINNHVPVWTKSGKEDLSSETYMSIMESFKPDIFHVLCDTDTEKNSSKKRTIKSLERTLTFFEKCLNFHKNSEKLKNTKLIGSLVGGYCEEAREHCSVVVGAAPVFGVSIDGLHDCSSQVPFISTDQIKLAVGISLKHIPPDKLRICPGSWNPIVVLDLISLGVDIFDTTFPCMLAEDGAAFTFINDEKIFCDPETHMKFNGETNNGIQDNSMEGSDIEPVKKKFKLTSSDSKIYISLKDTVYFDDFEPISRDCNCITCRHHTKAYIHHLFNVRELLGPTLLTIHNLHYYVRFFETIRTSLKEGKFKNLKDSFQQQYCGSEDGKQISLKKDGYCVN